MLTLVSNPYMIALKDYWPIMLGIITGVYLLGKAIIECINKISRINIIEDDVGALKKDTTFIKGKVTTIEKMLKNILIPPATNYGIANSPIVLKEEFKPFIFDVGMDKEITKKEEELVEWLKSQKPATGIDAQDAIYDLIISENIEKYLSPRIYNKFKQNLYYKGKTSKDMYSILGIYLFERLIPKLGLPKDEEEKQH